MKLIDKDALVAEIERLKNIYNDDENIHHVAKYNILVDILSFIDTLEVKEVDLEDYYHKFLEKEWFGKHCNRTISEMMAFTAKHFFELGMQQSKNDNNNEEKK